MAINEEKSFDNMDIKVKIGHVIFNIMLDPSFFDENEDSKFSKHSHHSYEVHFIIKGHGSLIVENNIFSLSSNTICLIGPGLIHTQKEDPDNPIKRYSMKFNYETLWDSDIFSSVNESKGLIKVLSNIKYNFAQDINSNIIETVEKIHYELRNRKFGAYSKIQSYFMLMIIDLLRLTLKDEIYEYEFAENKDYMRDVIIENYFGKYYKSNCGAENLAAYLKVSRRHMNRLLKKYYNVSFKQKLLETRLEVAKDLLENTDQSIDQICKNIGYIQSSNFCLMFKKKTGMTPGDYRKWKKPNINS